MLALNKTIYVEDLVYIKLNVVIRVTSFGDNLDFIKYKMIVYENQSLWVASVNYFLRYYKK